MLQSQEFDRLDEAFKVVLEQGAKRVSYGEDEDQENVVSRQSYSFEKTAHVPIEEKLLQLGHPGTVPATCCLEKEVGKKWVLWEWVKGTGGHILIDPERPGVALGASHVEYQLSQISYGKQEALKEVSAPTTDDLSEELLSQWYDGYFEIMLLNKPRIDLSPFIKEGQLNRRTLDHYLTELGFEILPVNAGKYFKLKKGEWHIWCTKEGWEIAYCDPKTSIFEKPVRYGQGLKDGLEVALNYVERLQPDNPPSHALLEEAYLQEKASLVVDKINQREYIALGVRYFFHYEWGRGVRLFGSKGGWQVHDAKPVQEDDSNG